MIDSYDALVGDLRDRGMGPYAAYYAKYCLYATYFEVSRDIWQREDCIQYRNAVHKRLCEFYNKYRLLIKTVNEETTKKIVEISRDRTARKGKLNDMPPFNEWLNSILILFKGG